jgi:sialate O-acetylesterase
MTIEGKDRIELKNIMLGEVWVCSGQSNMEFTINMLGGWGGRFAADRDDLIRNGYGSVRLFTVARDTSRVPVDTCRGAWLLPDPDVVGDFSATAFFFGRELARTLKVPVGLIASSWGGTPAESWTRPGDLVSRPELALYLSAPNKTEWSSAAPGILYNAMIHPLIGYPIRGVIWYQGESNRNDAALYHELMGALIAGWREAWNLGSFPFYFTQIAPYNYEEPYAAALLREAQLKTLAVPNTGMAVTADIGDVNDIHPKDKQEVGRRLALWALARTYGVALPAYSGPLYRSMKREGRSVRVFFDHAEGGLVARGDRLGGCVVAGPDRVFVDAEARIDGSTLLVSSRDVEEPAAVRFAFTNTSESGLFNRAGLPASPFRTDGWPIVTATVTVTAAYDSSRGGILFDLASSAPGVDIRYTLDGSDPVPSSPLFKGKVSLTHAGSIKARAFQDGLASPSVARCDFLRHEAFGKPVAYAFPPDARYPGGGHTGLVDGVTGSTQFRDGRWQGFLKNDLDVTVDLGTVRELGEVRTGFFHNQGSWIFFPRVVEYSLSSDGASFRVASTVENDAADSVAGGVRKEFGATFPRTAARFVRVKARSIGVCPSWHPGRGQDAWLFVDEIIVGGSR